MENIYADHGGIISGDRYIHRKKAEREVRARLLENETFGSIGLVGMQRMGKSSLVYNLFESRQGELIKSRILVIKLVMYKYRTPQAFFVAIAKEVLKVLEDCGVVSAKLERRYRKIKEVSVEETGGERVRSFFKIVVSELKYRVICIIDEFDYSKKLFESYPEGFFVLRELAYQPENKIGFLFLSRHLMAELEAEVGYDVSNFSNILLSSYLTVYSDEEFEQYFQILEGTGVKVTDDIKEQYREITGKIPYWMDILSFHLLAFCNEGKVPDIYKIFDENQEIFYGEFQKFFKLLDEQNLLNTLYQVILGPIGDDVTPKQISRLKNYGIIDRSGRDGYITISKYFRQYMVMREQIVDFYPLWNRTEKLMRTVGAEALQKKYGADWEWELENRYVTADDSPTGHGHYMSIGDYILYAKNKVEEMKNKISVYEIDPAQITLLNGTTTGGLASILCAEYEDCFKPVFKMSKKEFRPLIDGITSARNPYDHSNDHFIRQDVKVKTNENCSKLIKLMEKYLGLQ